ncbi:hypothetical protein NDU88_002593 [Pleurodeles waltl]|uniref:Uncharacterized protein n=1 Tax=Pleurodeles waltl TaxID=8319 RepID=A0AAV7TL43_PLEWA|nr:hypothetical protein NDU88_002593 [Pleurodeles waltl]
MSSAVVIRDPPFQFRQAPRAVYASAEVLLRPRVGRQPRGTSPGVAVDKRLSWPLRFGALTAATAGPRVAHLLPRFLESPPAGAAGTRAGRAGIIDGSISGCERSSLESVRSGRHFGHPPKVLGLLNAHLPY